MLGLITALKRVEKTGKQWGSDDTPDQQVPDNVFSAAYRADNIKPPLKLKISDFFLGALNIFQKSPNLQKGFLIFSKIFGSKILV